MIRSSAPAPRLLGVASAFPKTRIDKEAAHAALIRLFPSEAPAFIAQLVERSGVDSRYIALPVEGTLTPRDFTERNLIYRAAGTELAISAAQRALAAARCTPTEIDCVIDVSCTGVAIPALDVDLVPALGLRRDVRRIPITESGCAAGALALGLAGDLARGGATTLVVAVELCSLTLCRDESRTNLVASVLFGDGAAAAILGPRGEGPTLVAAGSHLFEDTRGMMGFDVGQHGLRIVLQKELPGHLERNLRAAIEAFLHAHDRRPSDIGLHLVHPGGRRILETYRTLFALDENALQFSEEALRRYGNLSSASILTVLELALAAHARPTPGRDALLVGIGPGLSMEISLWSWN